MLCTRLSDAKFTGQYTDFEVYDCFFFYHFVGVLLSNQTVAIAASSETWNWINYNFIP